MFGYLFYLVVSKFVSAMPERTGYGIAEILAFFRNHQFRSGRRGIDENMKVVLGEKYSPELAGKIARRSMHNFAKNIVEIFRLPVIGDSFYEKRCTLVGSEHLETCLERGNGAIFLSAHIGNWELAVSIYAARGHKIKIIALPHNHPKTSELFIGARLSKNMSTLHSARAARPALRTLRRNGILGMLGERRTAEDGIRVKFFDREVVFPKGPWWLAVHSGAGVIPSVCLRRPDDTFIVISDTPLFAPEEGEPDEKMLTMAQRFAKFVEYYVRKFPDQWATFYPFWGEGPLHLLRAQG